MRCIHPIARSRALANGTGQIFPLTSGLMLTDQRFSRFRWPAVIGIALFFGFFYTEILRRILQEHHQSDFYHFYAATVAMSQGQDIYLSGTHGYVYPPLLAFLYLPLAHLSDVAAAAIALSINLPLMVGALLVGAQQAGSRLINHTDDEPTAPGLLPLIAILTAAVTFGRIKAELTIMQTDVIVLAAYVFAIYWVDRRPALAGIVLGFAMNIKYYTLPGLFYLLLRRRWRAAAGFGVSAIFFALLPALKVGLHTDFQYLSIAFGGVLKSIGVQTGQFETARVHHIYDSLSVSISSGLARMFRDSHPKLITPLTGLIILLFVLLVGWWYRRQHLPLLNWPQKLAQRAWPFRQLMILEWAGMMIASIVFSPDSNLRHMVLVLLTNTIAVTLLLAGLDRSTKIPLILGILLQIFAFDGVGHVHNERVTNAFFYVGGHGWCILIFYGIVLWAGLREVRLRRSIGDALPLAA
jgi:hypothetical protein